MQSKYSAMLKFGFDRFYLRPLSVCTRSHDLKPQMRHNDYEFPATNFEVVLVLVLVLVLDLKLSILRTGAGHSSAQTHVSTFLIIHPLLMYIVKTLDYLINSGLLTELWITYCSAIKQVNLVV